MNSDLIQLGKFLSYILRHHPEKIDLKLDANGWADVNELIEKINSNGYKITLHLLLQIVNTNDKKRYSFNDDKTKIRANQGHSIEVDLNLTPRIPPEILYHGTSKQFLDVIKQEGLTKQKRHHVHLSESKENAIQVGKRRGKPIILTIQSKQMHEDGYGFYLSENNVWLTDIVPPTYIS